MKTEYLKLTGGPKDDAVIDRAADLLREGGIVGFPTETVYGLAVNGDDIESVERLYELKGRPAGKPFTVHIADRSEVQDLVEHVPAVAKRLMERCWPGPLTIIFTRHDGSTLGVRLPDNEAARELIRRSECPVLAPSANLSGQPPATTAQQVMDVFDGQIEAVLDGGPSRYGHSSTVVRVVGEELEVDRVGVLSADKLKEAMNTSILFVCSGNSCRSPIAEGLCRKELAEKLGVPESELGDHGFVVASAGTRAAIGVPASFESQAVAKEMGVDLSAHMARPITEKMLRAADHIYVMTPEQMQEALEVCPDARGKVELLDSKGRAITDPHGGDLETYRNCARTILEALRKRLRKL